MNNCKNANTFRREALDFLGKRMPGWNKGDRITNADLRDKLAEIFFGAPIKKQAAYSFYRAKMKGSAPPPTVLSITKKNSQNFYRSDEWRRVRYQALKSSLGCCDCCGAPPEQGKPLHVDHIRPRSQYPELELVLSNLQVLCVDCNLGKSAWDNTDWRGNVVPFPNVSGQ